MAAVPRVAAGLEALLRPIDGLTEDPKNRRIHGGLSIDAIARSLRRFGQTKPIVVDADGTVRAGNGTLRAARALGWRQIAAVASDLDGDALAAYALADNRTGERSHWNRPALADQVAALLATDIDLANATGFQPHELDALRAASAEAALLAARAAEASIDLRLPPLTDDGAHERRAERTERTERTGGAASPPLPRQGAPVTYTLRCAAGDQRARFDRFAAVVRRRYPQTATLGAAVVAYLRDLGALDGAAGTA